MISKVFGILLLLVLPVALLSSSIYIVSTDHGWFMQEFSKYQVYEQVPAADEHSRLLISYLEGNTLLEENFYTAREEVHLKDVQELIVWNKKIVLVTVSMFLLCFFGIVLMRDWETLFVSLGLGSFVALVLYGVLFLMVMLNFSSAFTFFHEVSFANDFWLLDPATDHLIQMFPHGFFVDIFARMMMIAAVSAGILGCIALIIRKVLSQKLIYKKIS